jgi:hypothetical protein
VGAAGTLSLPFAGEGWGYDNRRTRGKDCRAAALGPSTKGDWHFSYLMDKFRIRQRSHFHISNLSKFVNTSDIMKRIQEVQDLFKRPALLEGPV